MSDLLRGEKVKIRRLTVDAIALASALILSYIEHLLPLTVIVPFPGIKLGLANIVVMLIFFCLSKSDAAAVSFVRVFLSAVLFGTGISFIMSFGGALLSYLSMLSVLRCYQSGKMSFIGISVISAVFHGTGQLIAASFIYTSAVFSYLPILMIGGLITGCFSGVISNIIYRRVEKVKNV